jgi:hypothetical protein
MPKDAAEVASFLSALVAAEVIERHTGSKLPTETEYGFRHALVRDAALSLLTGSDLATGHRLAGEYLEAAGERDPAVIAEHFQRGGAKDRAIPFFLQDAELSLFSSHLDRALHDVAQSIACGAQGEALGIAHSIEAFVKTFQLRPEGFVAGTTAMLLVKPGSRPWFRALLATSFWALVGPPEWQAKLPELLHLALTTEPEVEAQLACAESLGYLLGVVCMSQSVVRLQPLWDKLQAISNRASQRDPNFGRWLYAGLCHGEHHQFPRPWKVLQDTQRGIVLAQQAGDRRTQIALELSCRDLVSWELGDPMTVPRLQQAMNREETKQEAMFVGVAMMVLAEIQSIHPDPSAQEEALGVAQALIAGPAHPLTVGVGYDSIAKVRVMRKESAEAEARLAYQHLQPLPLWQLVAIATLIHAVLANRKMEEATQLAEEALAIIHKFGGAGFTEVEPRLAASEAFHAAGNLDRADAELRETLHQIQIRADDITDPFWKNSYLTRNPHCVRAQSLAKEWGLDVVVQ